jgi:hypothetical protein
MAGASVQSNEKKFMVRRLFWENSIHAVKLSSEFSDFKSFRRELEKSLPSNSSYVRIRRTRDILKWFFPSRSLDNLLTRVWTFYKNEVILRELMRYQYLTIEPIVGEFIRDYIIPLRPGSNLEVDYFKDFLLKKYGVVRPDPLNSLRGACRDMGFLLVDKKKLIVTQVPVPKTSLLILTHYLLAPSVRTIAIKEILSNYYWQYLGIRDSDSVRIIFREADANGLVAKYVVADQLEQVTTRYPFDEFIQRRLHL